MAQRQQLVLVGARRYRLFPSVKLGRGAFGEVFKGRDEDNRTPVAIKLISIFNNRQEIQILQGLHPHNNVVAFLGLCFLEKQSAAAIVMELCDCNLGRYYEKNRVQKDKAILLMTQCMEGLKHLHRHDIIHRDLKPWNILIKDGVAKITDFGLAQLMDATEDRILLEKYKECMEEAGTSGFMAPEIRARRVPSKSSDIYAMGVTFAWMNERGTRRWQDIQELADKMKSDQQTKRPSAANVLRTLRKIK